MDIFGILDPDPHENLCGSETLVFQGKKYNSILEKLVACTGRIPPLSLGLHPDLSKIRKLINDFEEKK